MWDRIRLFFTFWDARFEDLNAQNWKTTLYRDFSAGLITALTAIPMAMGFAMASGLRPEQGIIAGAVACLIGCTFGGSKYQVCGPTAAFIPILAALVYRYTDYYQDLGYDHEQAVWLAHGFLVFVSLISGVILLLMGLAGLGKYLQRIPASIVVGFTIGIGITIALTNLGEMLGYHTELRGNLFNKLNGLWNHFDEFNIWALLIALLTFALIKILLRVSIFIPAPLIALGVATFLSATALSSSGLVLIQNKYGAIPSNFFAFTGPHIPDWSLLVLFDVCYFVVAIVFISAVESLLCSSMADRLANNKKTPFNPDKEFWGQGLVQLLTPLCNGMPCTGALARTATSIKTGAVTPFAGYFKSVLKIGLAVYLASYLELVPMACIGGILLWVASNMIKWREIHEIMLQGRFQTLIMAFTAVMVPMTNFLTGVATAMVLYWILSWFVDTRSEAAPAPELPTEPTLPERIGA